MILNDQSLSRKMTTEAVHPTKSTSPFFSVFRKKQSPTAATSSNALANENPVSPQISFSQRVKMHKDLRDGKVPELFLSNTSPIMPSTSIAPLPLFKKSDKEIHKLKKNKAFSTDAIDSLDPEYLTEALEAIGDEQPIVARSIPKHAVIEVDQKSCQERLRQNCIYEPEVYDKMLAESLAVCDMLQSHLDDCIATTRAKSPSPISSTKTTPKKQPPPVPQKTKKIAFQLTNGSKK